MKHEELSKQIIKVFYQVYNELGYGFLERVYQNALFFALKEEGLNVEPNRKIKVWFRGFEVGDYFADLIVNDTIILELKAIDRLIDVNEAKLLNYLRGTEIEVGLLLNFGKKPEVRRKVYDNELKKNVKL